MRRPRYSEAGLPVDGKRLDSLEAVQNSVNGAPYHVMSLSELRHAPIQCEHIIHSVVIVRTAHVGSTVQSARTSRPLEM